MSYPALHGFLCARLAGPVAPDWQDPLAGLLPHDAALDEKSAEALHHLIAELEDQLTTFWFDNVIADIAPEGEAIQEVEPVSGASIEATPDVSGLIEELKELKGAIDELSSEKAAIEENIKSFLGEAEILMAPGGHKPLATWKGSQRTTLDGTALKRANPSLWSEFSKTTTTRTFRVI